MAYRIIPAIMSGGAGTRLWPLSTEDKPKQFHALVGARSMFAETVARLSGDIGDISFAAPIVLCGEKHVAPVRTALAEVESAAAAILIEPAARNTAAVAATAALTAHDIDPDALVFLAPADHVITDTTAFHRAIAAAARFARERIVTFGMSAAHPATIYGYIKQGEPLDEDVFAIEAFKEKPDEETAQLYLRTGGYSWNGGMFLFSPALLLAEFEASADIRETAREALRTASHRGDEVQLGSAYAEARSLPLDIAVMEQTQRAAVVPCDIGWADVGSWAEVWRLAPRNATGFSVLGAAAAADNSKMEASGIRTAVIEGAHLVVVAAPNGLLIVPRDRAGDLATLRDLDARL